MIREAVESDVPEIVRMGVSFLRSTHYRYDLAENVAQMEKTALHLIGSDNGVIFVGELDGTLTGMIGLMSFPHHLSGELVAGEVFWWQEPGARGTGIRLLRQAERWSKARGVKTLHMIAPNDQTCRVYERLGFSKLEVAFKKDLT